MAIESHGCLLSVEEAAQRLRLSPHAVVTLIEADVIEGRETGHGWVVSEDSLALHNSFLEAECRDSCEGRPLCGMGSGQKM